MKIKILTIIILFILGLFFYVSTNTQNERYEITHSNINSYFTAINLFQLDNGRIPTSHEGLSALIKSPTDLMNTWKGPYIEQQYIDPWGNEYKYITPGLTAGSKFSVYSFGPNKIDEKCKGDDECIPDNIK